MSFDYAKSSSASCSLPEGIDVFFAMNQRSDAKCTEANECVACIDAGCTDKKSAYSLYTNILKESLCQVAWDALE